MPATNSVLYVAEICFVSALRFGHHRYIKSLFVVAMVLKIVPNEANWAPSLHEMPILCSDAMRGPYFCDAPIKCRSAPENSWQITETIDQGINATVMAFRAQFRGVRDIPFFIFRLASLRSAGHCSWQIRQPEAQSKLRELRQRARSACFVPVNQKMQNNWNFTLSQNFAKVAAEVAARTANL